MNALYIILSVLLLFVLLLYLPIRIRIRYDEELMVKVHYLFFFYTISPQKEKVKVKRKKAKKTRKDNRFGKSVKENGLFSTFENIKHYIIPIVDILKKFEKNIIVKPFKFKLIMVSEDAAKLAIDYGKFCSLFYTALSYLNNRISIKDIQTNISVDYLKSDYEFYFDTTIRFKVIFLISSFKSIIWEINKLKKSNNIKGRVVTNEREH